MSEVEESKEEKENKEFSRCIRNEFSFRRTRSDIVRLVNSNPGLKVFITLTFDDKKQMMVHLRISQNVI